MRCIRFVHTLAFALNARPDARPLLPRSLPFQVAELEQAAALRAKKYYDAVETDSHSTRFSTLLNLLRTHTILFPSSSSGFAPPSLPPALAQLTGQEVAAIGYLQHALISQAEASLVEAISRGNSTEVLEGVTFARVYEILSSLPSFTTTTEQVTADAPSTSETKEYQPLQFGSSGLNEENPVPPPQQQHQQPSTDDDVRIAHASFTSPQSGGGQQMSFGTAVEGSFAPPPPPPAVAHPAFAQRAVAQEEVVGKPGLEGEGESLAVVDDFTLPSETVESSISAGNADAPLDRTTDSPAPATTGDEAAPRERRQRGPRRRKPKTVSGGETETAESSPAPTPRSAGGDGEEVKKRERRPKTPKTNGDSNGEASNGAPTGRRAGGGGDRRRQGPRKEGGAAREGGSTTEDGGFQPAPARRHGATAKPSSAGVPEGTTGRERGGRGGGARGRGGRGARTNGGTRAEGGAPVAPKTPAAPKAD